MRLALFLEAVQVLGFTIRISEAIRLFPPTSLSISLIYSDLISSRDLRFFTPLLIISENPSSDLWVGHWDQVILISHDYSSFNGIF